MHLNLVYRQVDFSNNLASKFLISSRDGGNFKKVCYGKGRMGSNYVWWLSFGTIVFLGIREAAKIMSRSLKLAPLQTPLRQ